MIYRQGMPDARPPALVLEAPRLRRRARLLVQLTLAYNVIEGVLALWAGEVAGSIALIGFGFDSAIETSASALVLWRLSVESRGGSAERVASAERTVCRVVGVSFLLLAAYVAGQAGWNLWTRAVPEASTIGIALASASVAIMPLLTWAKVRVARGLGSAALEAEAKETLACAILSVPLLLGLLANAALGWWWADPVAALCMVPWLVKEARHALRGKPCCGRSEATSSASTTLG
jgi:divalent metal cation (Fe/Co/Zn/Cd) transporter